MKHNLEQELKAFAEMDRESLLAAWPRYFKEPPRSTRREHVLAEISYRVQAKAYGGLSATARNKLERMAFGGQLRHQPKVTLQLESRLVREWNGCLHTVIVSANGYEYEGQCYRSLSKVAAVITGAHWSGPLFFGVKKPGGVHEKAA